MDLLEYQAKELFRQMGIPVLPSQRIDHPRDLKGLKIPYPVVLKSQVYSGGRGKAGGIRFAANTIDAVAAAQTIFHLPIMGQYPDVLLAEAKYELNQELYLAVVLDRSTRRPLLLGSQGGGEDIESIVEQLQQVVVDQEFSPFYARRLALKMGLQGELIQSVGNIVEKMYRLFVQKDLDLVEINPLAISPTGELMALDGKIVANDDALGRHDDLAALQPKPTTSKLSQTAIASPLDADLVELDGTISILCNGGGLTMATLDLVHRAGGNPANVLNVGGECHPDTLPVRVTQGLELVTQSRTVKGVLVNILSTVASCSQIATAIKTYIQRRRSSNHTPPLVVRLMGNDLEQARTILSTINISLVESLDEAIVQAVALGNVGKG